MTCGPDFEGPLKKTAPPMLYVLLAIGVSMARFAGGSWSEARQKVVGFGYRAVQ